MKKAILLYLVVFGVFSEGILAALLNVDSTPVTLFQIAFSISFIAYIYFKFLTDDFEVNYNNYALLVIIFSALIFLSLIYSPDRVNGFFNGIRFLVLILFIGFITNLVAEKHQLIKVMLLVSIIGVLLAVFSIGESLFNPEAAIQNLLSQGSKLNRSSAGDIYSDPNRFAASLFLPLAFGFSVMNSRIKTTYRVAGGLLFMLILGGIITSYSRSGFLAVAVICIINIFIFKRFKPFVILGVIGVVAILLIPTFRLTFASYSERILDLLTGAIDTSSNIRIMLGIASINMFIDSYGLGVGFDAFSERFTSYYSIQETVGVVEPHNLTYTVLAELGMQGFIIFILIVFFLFKDALLNIRNAETIFDRILSVSFFCSFCGYILFYQFYGGGLTDNILMFNIALILTHKKFLHKSDSGLR